LWAIEIFGEECEMMSGSVGVFFAHVDELNACKGGPFRLSVHLFAWFMSESTEQILIKYGIRSAGHSGRAV
jgi:hypothetical protein